ncbi:MAG: hypothetical protein WCP28_07240 [Actinomycetes bacterium]
MTDIDNSPAYQSFKDVIDGIVQPPLNETKSAISDGLTDLNKSLQELETAVQNDVATKADIRNVQTDLRDRIGEENLALSDLISNLGTRVEQANAAINSVAALVADSSEQTRQNVTERCEKIESRIDDSDAALATSHAIGITDMEGFSARLDQLHAQMVDAQRRHDTSQRRLVWLAACMLVALLALTGFTAWRTISG